MIEHCLTATQSALVSQRVAVLIEQLPATGHAPLTQALSVRLQVPPTFGQLAFVWHCALLMRALAERRAVARARAGARRVADAAMAVDGCTVGVGGARRSGVDRAVAGRRALGGLVGRLAGDRGLAARAIDRRAVGVAGAHRAGLHAAMAGVDAAGVAGARRAVDAAGAGDRRAVGAGRARIVVDRALARRHAGLLRAGGLQRAGAALGTDAGVAAGGRERRHAGRIVVGAIRAGSSTTSR